ncbi:hypothetical protein MNEG_15812 [Monoraphidium neglectum]|uniref:Uncharacterized protein n=1 Tax=Monoraphidium neglectum TaxID=145388 RepID=A0A0D2M9Y5_9CHLO|nr:hypothetical protein MNEG_15812 [Monoraphidium neglectum]KIY92150.1 hypothetical protein MNEG_15812 [Monoraphidium neglectum]|eukprot:XP_013891170.1 hypothetical protein MNEG_15812 [Monoraphidium neglectum]
MLRSPVGLMAPGMAIHRHTVVPLTLGSRAVRVLAHAPRRAVPSSSGSSRPCRAQHVALACGGEDGPSSNGGDTGGAGGAGNPFDDAEAVGPLRPDAAASKAGAWLATAAKLAGGVVLFAAAAALQPRASHAAAAPPAADSRLLSNEQASTSGGGPAPASQQQQQQQQRRRAGGWRRSGGANPAADLAASAVDEVYVGPGAGGGSKATGKGAQVKGGGGQASPLPAPKDMERIISGGMKSSSALTDPDLQALIGRKKAEHYRRTRQAPGSDKARWGCYNGAGDDWNHAYEASLQSKLGVPLDFDDLMTSQVYAPQDVPGR